MPRQPWPGRSRRRAPRRVGLALRAEAVDAAGQAALVARSGVAVKHTLLHGLVDRACRLGKERLRGRRVGLRDRLAELLDLGLNLREVPAVAGPALEALPHLLQGRRVMSHSLPPT